MRNIKLILGVFLVVTIVVLLVINVLSINREIAEATQISHELTQAVEKTNAEIQKNRTISGQLGVQAQKLAGDSEKTLRLLLAIQAMRLFPSHEVMAILQNETQPAPTPRMVVGSLAMSADHKYMVVANYDSNARASEVATGKNLGMMLHDGWVNSLAFSPDDLSIISGSEDKTARVWDTVTGKEISRMVHTAPVKAVALDPNTGKYVASGDDAALVILWQAATGQEVFRMKHDTAVTALAFSPNGKYLASGSTDKTIRLWDVATGEEILRMKHEGAVNAVVFGPNGDYLASGSADKTARVWDVLTGQEIARMEHPAPVVSVAFSADGKSVISGGIAAARTWQWQPDDLIASACSHIPRNLTRAEWQQYMGEALAYQAVCPNLPLAP